MGGQLPPRGEESVAPISPLGGLCPGQMKKRDFGGGKRAFGAAGSVDFRGHLQAWMQEGFRTLYDFTFGRAVPGPDFLVFPGKLRFWSGA